MASSSELWSTAVTDPCGPMRCARLIAGSPVPLARSTTCIPGCGFAYSTIAAVTALPITADFAFHLSEATRRNEEPHGAGSDAGMLRLLFSRARRRRCCFLGSLRHPALGRRGQLRGLDQLGRFP